MAWHRTRSKFGVHTDTVAVKAKETELLAQGLSKKDAAHTARLAIYANRSADGIVFGSKKERNRYVELSTLLHAGEIRNLKRQVRYCLHVNGIEIGKYIADFTYYRKDGVHVVEDSKGKKTPVYERSKKHMKAEHGIDIYET